MDSKYISGRQQSFSGRNFPFNRAICFHFQCRQETRPPLDQLFNFMKCLWSHLVSVKLVNYARNAGQETWHLLLIVKVYRIKLHNSGQVDHKVILSPCSRPLNLLSFKSFFHDACRVVLSLRSLFLETIDSYCRPFCLFSFSRPFQNQSEVTSSWCHLHLRSIFLSFKVPITSHTAVYLPNEPDIANSWFKDDLLFMEQCSRKYNIQENHMH